MKLLLKLYPPAWQRRYRNEVETYLQAEPPNLRTALDLLAGAIDAWLNPDSIPKAAIQESNQAIAAARWGSVNISPAEARRGGTWMLGVCVVLATTSMALTMVFGPHHIAIEALLYSAFFIALTISGRYTWLKSCSRITRNAIIGLTILGWYLFFLAVAMLSSAI